MTRGVTPRRGTGRGPGHWVTRPAGTSCSWSPAACPRWKGGVLYDTVLAFNQRGHLAAWHRKTHLYAPTLEHSVFAAGERLTTFDDPMLGRVGLVAGFEADVPEVARALALRGARLVLAPSATEVERAPAWDLLHPAWALANSQWWVQANQAGSHASWTLLGQSRIIAPTGTVVAEASAAVPGGAWAAELLVHRIDFQLAHRMRGRRRDSSRTSGGPALYAELVERVPAQG